MDKSLKRFSTHLIDLMAHLEISEGIHSDVVFSEPGSGSLSLSLSLTYARARSSVETAGIPLLN